MQTSMRNTVANEKELFDLIFLGLKHKMRFLSVTNLNDVTPFLSEKLKVYQVPNEHYFQIEDMKLIPGLLLWVSYGANQSIPILGYNFDAEQLHVDLGNAFIDMPQGQRYLNSYKAIELIKNAGGQVFLATSNMHPLPDVEQLDEIFAHHVYELDGLEAVGSHFKMADKIFYHEYAKDVNKQICGGDGYSPKYPTDMFGKTVLPECPLTRWLCRL